MFITCSTILFIIIPYPSSNIDSPLGLSFLLLVKFNIEKKNLLIYSFYNLRKESQFRHSLLSDSVVKYIQINITFKSRSTDA